MQPILEQAAETKAEAIDRKDKLEPRKKTKTSGAGVAAVDPGTGAELDDRSPAVVIQSVQDQGRLVTEGLARHAALVGVDDALVPSAHVTLR